MISMSLLVIGTVMVSTASSLLSESLCKFVIRESKEEEACSQSQQQPVQ